MLHRHRAECGMEINGVDHMAAGVVAKRDLHCVTLSHPDHWSGHLSVEGPIAVSGTNRWIQLTDYLFSAERHMDYVGARFATGSGTSVGSRTTSTMFAVVFAPGLWFSADCAGKGSAPVTMNRKSRTLRIAFMNGIS